MKQRTLMWGIAALAAMSLALVGCTVKSPSGSDDPDGPTEIDSRIGTEFSGGAAGAASADEEPIGIGMINLDGGTVSNPEAAAAAQAAVDYINAEQGGIAGHPIKLDICKTTGTEEEAQQCAQRFLNDSTISVILQDGLNVGSSAVQQTIDGAKPIAILAPNPGPDLTGANTFAAYPVVLAALPGVASFAAKQGYRTVSAIVDDNAGNLAIAQGAKDAMALEGVTLEITTFPEGTTDLTSAVTAALTKSPDAIVPITVTPQGCTSSGRALQQLAADVPVLGFNLCITDTLKQNLGDYPQWSYESTVLLLEAPDETGQIDFYRAVMAKYAGDDAELGRTAQFAFGTAFLIAKVLNTVGPDALSTDSVAAGFADYHDGVLMGPPEQIYGSIDGMPSLPNITDRFYTYEGDGNWSSTEWLNLPE